MSLKEGNLMKKILLIGDSAKKAYGKFVEMSFKDVATVYNPGLDNHFLCSLLRDLPYLKSVSTFPEDLDLIHWNLCACDSTMLADGEVLTPPSLYAYYVGRICKTMTSLFPKAKVIFATSIPKKEERFAKGGEKIPTASEYNAVAVESAKKFGAEINDLYAICENIPESYYSDAAHLCTKEGSRLLTEKVVSVIEKALGISASALDFDALFDSQNI